MAAGTGFHGSIGTPFVVVVFIQGSGALSTDRTLTRRDVKPSLYEARPPLAHVGASTPDAQ